MVGLIVAFAVSLAWCLTALVIGPRLGFVDRPDDAALKVHRRPTVPLGGVGIFTGVHAGMAWEGLADPGLLAATALLLTLGLVDDRWGVPPVARLATEVVAGVVLVTASNLELGPVGSVVGVILVVAAVNAVNLFDGLDGLAGSAALVSAAGIAWLASIRGVDETTALAIAASLVGFFLLNRHPARVFLGDNGAYVVGGLLTYAILAAAPEANLAPIAVGTLTLGVFLVDLVATLVRRRLARRPLFAGDRSHVYDQLRDQGWTIWKVVGAASLAQIGFVLAARIIDRLDSSFAPWIAFAVGCAAVAALGPGGFLTPNSVDVE